MSDRKDKIKDARNRSTSNTDDDGDNDDSSVKDEKAIVMYVGEDRARDVNILYDELNAKYKRVNDTNESLPKSAEYYRALLDVALEHEDEVAEELGLK